MKVCEASSSRLQWLAAENRAAQAASLTIWILDSFETVRVRTWILSFYSVVSEVGFGPQQPHKLP